MVRKAGSIVLDRLRERVLLGRYFGCWSPGDRLPSVREVAEQEAVDRKTAAAAYRHLQEEGLVRVEPRSGVYMEADGHAPSGDPLRRLHRQWLEHTLASAGELGLTSSSIGRMLQGVALVEGHRIPVVDQDPAHGALLASELNARTGLACAPCRPEDLPASAGPFRDAPFVVATPTSQMELRPTGRRLPIVQATLDPGLLDSVREASRTARVTVVVGTAGLKRELGRALDYGLVGAGDRVTILLVDGRRNGVVPDATTQRVVLWPGTPEWVVSRLNGGVRDLHRSALLSASTIAAARAQVARSAMEYLNRSSVS